MALLPNGRSERLVFDLKSNLVSAVLGGVIGAMAVSLMSQSGVVGPVAPALQSEVGRLTQELSDLKRQQTELKKEIESRRGVIPLALRTGMPH